MSERLRAAMALARVPGLGPAGARALIEKEGDPLAALSAREGRGPGGRRLPTRVMERVRRTRPVAEEELERLSDRGIRVVHYGGEGYPETLETLTDPPTVLYLQGPLSPPSGGAVAIVGTRRATGYGRRMAVDLSAGLAAEGLTVVSGLARGIDGAAHRGALEAEGRTLAVLGSGLDHEYPASNRSLYRAMRRRGLLVSEHSPGVPPAAGHFPRRNRLIAALADAVVVVQAGAVSGALITADLALDLGRPVLAVPGPVGPDASVGVHGLLRDGAAPVTCVEDVRRALDLENGAGACPGLTGEPGPDRLAVLLGRDAERAAALCAGLREGPRDGDGLARSAGVDPTVARGILVRLELYDLVRELPGGRWALPPPSVGTRPARDL